MKCPSCGALNPNDNLFCEECGEKLEKPKLTCPECGKEQKKDDPKFCPFCGYRFQAQPMVGDKNVIAGDVISDSHDTIHHTTNIYGVMPGQSASDMVECHVCGRLIKKDSGDVFRCRSCMQYVCSDCYDRNSRMCFECTKKSVSKKSIRPELALFEYEEIGNGKVTVTGIKNRRALSIELPNCVESVGDSAFEGCSALSVKLNEGLLMIGKRAFADCKDLDDIKFPKTIRVIGDEAFAGCACLDAELPSGARIGKNVMSGTAYEARKKAEAEAKRKALLEKYKPGSIVEFGSYPQDSESRKDPIKWRVLKVEDGAALLLAEKILDAHRYDPSGNNWEKSEVRAWLNGEFLDAAFSKEEQTRIALRTQDNSPASTNPKNNPQRWNKGKNEYCCADTSDKVFLLSESEVTDPALGFNDDPEAKDKAREKAPTAYAVKRGVYKESGNGNGWWWLRSPDCNASSCARSVRSDGIAGYSGFVDYSGCGVVPALWVTLE